MNNGLTCPKCKKGIMQGRLRMPETRGKKFAVRCDNCYHWVNKLYNTAWEAEEGFVKDIKERK